jgi:hypothetical protein
MGQNQIQLQLEQIEEKTYFSNQMKTNKFFNTVLNILWKGC